MTPTLFVSHGSPALILEESPSREFLDRLAERLGTPRAILCVSAHWETAGEVGVNLAERPETIHDFYGFPEALYKTKYPVAGDPVLGREVVRLLGSAGIAARGEAHRGIDHGVWSPLCLIYPDARIPVVEISVQPGLDAAHHLAVGQALAPLREEGVLIVGSGSATHNLREIGRQTPHAMEFEAWLCEAVEQGRVEDLVAANRTAPAFLRNHPTPEHFLPLFAPLGASGAEARGEALNRHFEYGSLSMAAFLWGG